VLVFPEKWAAISDRIKTDIPVLLKGGYSKRDRDAEMPTFIVESVTPFSELVFSGQVGVAITIGDGKEVTSDVLNDVRAVVETHSTGSTVAPALEVRWRDGNGGTRLRSRSLRLPASHAALTELRALLGADRVHLVRAG
jgi:DNA polymerase-3 subunit alpha